MEKKEKELQGKNLRYMRDKDRQKVKGIFRYHEVPGGVMGFVFKAYKEDKVESFKLRDGEVYELPLGVAKHLNKNCSYPEYAHLVSDTGMPIETIGKQIRRCSFQSLEFVDVDDMTPQGVPAGT